MIIPFTKASACGNDFLIVEGANAPPDIFEFSRRICDRHNGVGADGVELLFPADSQGVDMSIRLINADGGEAEVSGNGTRCVAAYLVAGGAKEKLAIRTGAGIKHCLLIARNGHSFTFEMDMGQPQVAEDHTVTVSHGEFRGTPVSMGNPHYAIFVDDFWMSWQAIGEEIGRHRDFEEGVNVEFVRVAGRNEIEVRFYERGVGETQSSGTGSSASAVAAIARGHADSPVSVHAPGGIQIVRWVDQRVFLRGPAQIICRGEFFV